MKFYHDIKGWISPSAYATWHTSKQAFVKSYFRGEKSPETMRMKAGTMIHGLIEAGLIKTQKSFDLNEKTLTHPINIDGGEYTVLGKPDSYGLEDSTGYFVDYKSGGENSWTREKLSEDLKMKLTAWLVWKELGCPQNVLGYIAWIGTEWNGTEIVPVEDEYSIIKYNYTADELYKFEQSVKKTITDINDAYEKFLENADSESLVDIELVKEFARIDKEIKAIKDEQISPLEARLDEIKERVDEQLAIGGKEQEATDFGTFYYKSTKKYVYPSDGEFMLDDGTKMTVDKGEKVENAISAYRKAFQKYNNPVDEKKSLQFRAKK